MKNQSSKKSNKLFIFLNGIKWCDLRLSNDNSADEIKPNATYEPL
ncbi:hypothetical protein [Helicobacter pylori]|nr:hypothetical protein [Helicobacter pylori]